MTTVESASAPAPFAQGVPSGRSAPRLRSLTEVLVETDEKLRAGTAAAARVWPTGFDSLDVALTGGFRSGELILLGGPQGLGKTAMALQMLRNTVTANRTAMLFSYEHDAHGVLERLVAIEAGAIAGTDAIGLTKIRQAVRGPPQPRHLDGGAVRQRQRWSRGGRAPSRRTANACTCTRPVACTPPSRRSAAPSTEVDRRDGQGPLVLVDYLQKVPVRRRLRRRGGARAAVVERLKDMALEFQVPVLAIAAADKDSLAAGKRMRVSDLRGSSALAYEADVMLILNDKYDIVAKHHLVYHLEQRRAVPPVGRHVDREEPQRCRPRLARVPGSGSSRDGSSRRGGSSRSSWSRTASSATDGLASRTRGAATMQE